MIITIYPPISIYELGNRPNQEDALFPPPETASEQDFVFVLCDGMGGHTDGDKASRVVADALGHPDDKATNFSIEDFDQKLNEAYDRLDAVDNGEARKMGTTFCYVRFNNEGCLVAHMGDSRVYHIRPSERKILYKSKDHSLVQSLYDIGEITKEEMRMHPQKNIVTRVMQPNLGVRHNPEIRQLTDLRKGDIIYLCSDGMLEQMEDEELVRIFSVTAGNDKRLTRVLRKVTEGNRDNHSAWIIRIRAVERQENVPEIMPILSEPVAREVCMQQKEHLLRWVMFLMAFLVSLLVYLLF